MKYFNLNSILAFFLFMVSISSFVSLSFVNNFIKNDWIEIIVILNGLAIILLSVLLRNWIYLIVFFICIILIPGFTFIPYNNSYDQASIVEVKKFTLESNKEKFNYFIKYKANDFLLIEIASNDNKLKCHGKYSPIFYTYCEKAYKNVISYLGENEKLHIK